MVPETATLHQESSPWACPGMETVPRTFLCRSHFRGYFDENSSSRSLTPEEEMCITYDEPWDLKFEVWRVVIDIIFLFYMIVQLRLDLRARRISYVNILDVLVLPIQWGSYIIPGGDEIHEFWRFGRFFYLLILRPPIGWGMAAVLKYLIGIPLFGLFIGGIWYFTGYEYIEDCLKEACENFFEHSDECLRNTYDYFCHSIDCSQLIRCEEGENVIFQNKWRNYSSTCFSQDHSRYGIFEKAINLTTHDLETRFHYSAYWGLQQFTSFGGNLIPSYKMREITFTFMINYSGFFYLGFWMADLMNIFQSRTQRDLEASLRLDDLDKWMVRHDFPPLLRSKMLEAEHHNWKVTRGITEETLLANCSDELKIEIRRHIIRNFISRRVSGTLLDYICERLSHTLYIKETEILKLGDPVDKVVFIMSGKTRSTGHELAQLGLGEICGVELLLPCLEDPPANNGGNRILSDRTTVCLTNVEAYVLRAADIEEIIRLQSENQPPPEPQRPEPQRPEQQRPLGNVEGIADADAGLDPRSGVQQGRRRPRRQVKDRSTQQNDYVWTNWRKQRRGGV